MRFFVYSDLRTFAQDTMDSLRINEAQNKLLINRLDFRQAKTDTSDWLMATVCENSGAIIMICLMVPHHHFLLYEINNAINPEAEKLLSREILGLGIVLRSVMAEKGLAERFTQYYCAAAGTLYAKGVEMKLLMLERIYETEKSRGRLRLAVEDDLFFLAFWAKDFSDGCFGRSSIEDEYLKAKINIERQSLYLWVDDIPVAMINSKPDTTGGVSVSGVYTPPFMRGRGYATSAVAELSGLLLGSGKKYCYLFVDTKKITCTGIFTKIGYKVVSDYSEILVIK